MKKVAKNKQKTILGVPVEEFSKALAESLKKPIEITKLRYDAIGTRMKSVEHNYMVQEIVDERDRWIDELPELENEIEKYFERLMDSL